MATYYKKKDEVSLRPGQTLGYTAGKGYYAAGTPTRPEPPPAAAAPARQASAAPTATRPVAAQMPTAPERVGSKPTLVSPTSEAADLAGEEAERSDARAGRSASSAIPKVSDLAAHYEHAGDVPIKPGQTLAFAAERGYYAAGRQNPTKAPTTPTSSTTKITALSTRGSTESPLKEHVETRDGRTTITLSHATKPGDNKPPPKPAEREAHHGHNTRVNVNRRAVKPTADPSHKYKTGVPVKKASTLVHKQVAHTRRRAATDDLSELLAAYDTLSGKGTITRAGPTFLWGPYAGHTDIKANLPKAHISYDDSDGDLVATAGSKTLYSVNLGGLVHKAEDVRKFLSEIGDALSPHYAVELPDGVVLTSAFSFSDGLSITISRGGVDTEVAFKLDGKVAISTLVTEHVKKIDGTVDLLIDTTLSRAPRVTRRRGERPEPHPTYQPVSVPTTFPSLEGPELEKLGLIAGTGATLAILGFLLRGALVAAA